MRRALPLVLFGCQLTGTIGRDDPNGGSGGGTLVADTEMGVTAGEVGGTAEGGGTGSDTDAESTGGSESTAGIPHACIPTPDDSECSECRKVQCCEPLEDCLAHEPCTCWWECIQVDGHTADGCAMVCGTDHMLYDGLETCTHGHCPACP